MTDTQIKAADVKALRDRTGAAMMDSKKALQETGGDMEKAVELLRVKGQAQVAKRGGRATGEGRIATYSHAGKIGVLVEVQCETDFVARNENFVEFANDLALHIAAAAPRVVAAEDIPEDEVAAEKSVFEQKAAEDGKPENVREKIVEGQLNKWRKEIALLEQVHVNGDKHEGKTIKELLEEAGALLKENIKIVRFARFALGEGDEE